MKSYEEMTESVLMRRDNYISEKKIRMKKVKRAAVSVVCVSLVCLCTLLIVGEIRNKPTASGTMGSFYSGGEGRTETEEKIAINEVKYEDFVLVGVYSPESYDITVLNEREAAEHLGKELDFSFLPDYLKASYSNSQNEIYRDKNTGKVVDGGIPFTYWNEYGEDKLPISVGCGGKGISFTVCREDEAMLDRYKWPESAKASYFGEERVLIAVYEMEALGEYDSDTWETEIIPYNVYVAKFSSGGLRFIVTAVNFTDDEFIEILTDFINTNKG